MMRILVITVLSLVCAACVHTGGNDFKADYEQAALINTRLGMDYLAQGRYELAQVKLEKALSQDDSIAMTHLGLALVHHKFEEDARARKYFEKAVELAPRDASILTQYAIYLCQGEQFAKAESYFQRAIADKRNKQLESSYTDAGQCELTQGKYAEAENYLRQALERNPRYTPALLRMASLYYEQNEYLRSRAFLQRLEALQVSSADALLLGLRIEYALGDRAATQRYATRLKELVPGIEHKFDLKTGQAWQ